MSPTRSAAILLGLALTCPAIAGAQTAGKSADAPFTGSAVSDGALGRIAGREDHGQTAFANQAAGVSHNSVGDNVRTGDARIADNAFQNLSGLSILNVNTGNNVAINSAMNVAIAINPGQ